MGILNTILGKLGLGKDQEPAAHTNPASPRPNGPAASTNRPNPSRETPPTRPAEPVSRPAGAQPPDNSSIPVVDVISQLELRAAASSQKLNWRTSIVDLLKLLEIDSSLEARKELARELHCPLDLMEDSAQMNTWLHRTVLSRIAANGGNVPKDLTD